MDRRSDRPLAEAILENQQVMHWYAGKQIPVEVNESHQWSLRDAHDSLAVAMAFLAAYNAKKAGVRHYVSQFMFNTPPGTRPAMDLAKMSAKLGMISTLEDDTFTVFREVRAGIAHFSPIPEIAKGQLAASALISMAMKPHILHVVGHSEGDHATRPEELIESCRIVHGVLLDCLDGLPDMIIDPKVIARQEYLLKEATYLLKGIKIMGEGHDDPWANPHILAGAIREGLLDTPHFRGNPHLKGEIATRLIDGAWYAIDPESGQPISEEQRVNEFLKRINKL
jgi:hypothetical protein